MYGFVNALLAERPMVYIKGSILTWRSFVAYLLVFNLVDHSYLAYTTHHT